MIADNEGEDWLPRISQVFFMEVGRDNCCYHTVAVVPTQRWALERTDPVPP